MKEVFALQGMDELLSLQKRHDELTAEYATLG
jgi:hypothetical protein